MFDFTSGLHQARVGDSTIVYEVKPNDNIVEIQSIRTPQSKRGKGSARKATELFLKQTDANGFTTKLYASGLDKKTNDAKLIRFYESLGFKATGRTINAYGSPEMIRYAPKTISEAYLNVAEGYL